MELFNWPWQKFLWACLSAFCFLVLVFMWQERYRFHKLKRWTERNMPKRIEEIMTASDLFDPATDGLIVPIEVAACLVYRYHSRANPQAINHLSLLIFSACRDAHIKSYDSKTLFPTAKLSGLAKKWGKSSVFLGEVNPNNVFNTSVNALEVMEWLSNEGFLFCRATMYQLRARLNPPSGDAVPLVEVAQVAEKTLSTTERNNLLKLVIGMAVKGYSHDPAASKSTAPKEITDDLADLGISISDDTVRKYLKEAATVALPARPRQS